MGEEGAGKGRGRWSLVLVVDGGRAAARRSRCKRRCPQWQWAPSVRSEMRRRRDNERRWAMGQLGQSQQLVGNRRRSLAAGTGGGRRCCVLGEVGLGTEQPARCARAAKLI